MKASANNAQLAAETVYEPRWALQDQFPRANLIGGDGEFEELVA